MTIDLLNDFIHEELGYKSNISVGSFIVHGNYIQIIPIGVDMGEVIHIEKYENWLSKRRDNKINELI